MSSPGRKRLLLLPGVLAVAAVGMLACSTSDSAGVRDLRTYTAPRLAPDRQIVRFAVPGVRPAAIRRGQLRIGGRSIKLRTMTLRRGFRHGVIALRLRRRTAALARVHQPRLRLRTRRFPAFDGLSESRGRLTISREHTYDGTNSIRARFEGGGGGGFQRVWRDVHWRTGSDVWYGMALYVPHVGDYCYWNPIRWDNYRTYGGRGDVGGLTVDHGKLTVMESRYGREERTLIGPVGLPEARWVLLQVHQRLASAAGRALTQLYVDGQLMGSSSAPNTQGRVVNTVRFGVVNVAGRCSQPGEVFFDQASIARRVPRTPAEQSRAH